MKRVLVAMVFLNLFSVTSVYALQAARMVDVITARSVEKALPVVAQYCAEEIPIYRQNGYVFTGIDIKESADQLTAGEPLPAGIERFEFNCRFEKPTETQK